MCGNDHDLTALFRKLYVWKKLSEWVTGIIVHDLLWEVYEMDENCVV
jgi:hypothetical protein